MNKKCCGVPGIMIAGVRSSSGKTTVTCALLRTLLDRGFSPSAFKCGPDYIDPMFHREVVGISSRNLDSYFSDESMLREIYETGCSGHDICVVEGVMGLFDGVGGVSMTGSSYEIASILNLPIILIVDAYGCARSLIPIISGFLGYDRNNLIVGVILNRISVGFYNTIAPVIEDELHLPVFGFLPKQDSIGIDSRHLGLMMPDEIVGIKDKLGYLTEMFERCVNVDKIIEKTLDAAVMPDDIMSSYGIALPEPSVRVGVARDEAFCFYYEENLDLLRHYGAELVFFSPIHDEALPDDIDGLLLGGGYPENHARELEKNVSMRRNISNMIIGGMPSVAECGGFMYLHERLIDDTGKSYQMCGIISGQCIFTEKSVRFGYVEIAEKNEEFLKSGSVIRGHEFHYYDSDDNGSSCTASRPSGINKWECIHSSQDHFWGFPHLYYPSNSDFVVHLVTKAKSYRQNKGRQHGKFA